MGPGCEAKDPDNASGRLSLRNMLMETASAGRACTLKSRDEAGILMLEIFHLLLLYSGLITFIVI